MKNRRSHIINRYHLNKGHIVVLLALALAILLAGVPGGTSHASFTTINWQFLSGASHPVATSEAQSVTLNNRLYSFGGFGPGYVPYRLAYVFDPATNNWTQLANMPKGLTHSGFTTDGTNIFYAGGYIENSTQTGQIFGTTEAYRYNVATNTYTALPSLPVARAAGVLAYYNGRLHYIGGTNMARTQDVGDHYVLDIAGGATAWTTAAPLPNPRHHMGVAVFNGLIYVIGGQHRHDGQLIPQSDVHTYNPATNTWNQVASLPQGRNHMTGTTVIAGNRIVIMGGQTTHNTGINNVTAYDPVINTWTELSPLTVERHSAIGAYINDRFYFTSGNATSTFRGTPVFVPQVNIQITPESQTVNSGGSATFSVRVYNNGNYALNNVSVSNPGVGGCATSIGALSVGQIHTYTCTINGIGSSFTNTVTATGASAQDGTVVTHSDSAQVTVNPGRLTIFKQATPEGPQTFSFTASGGLGSFTLFDDGSVPASAVNHRINFQSETAPVPAGYLRDFGEAYGARSGANQGSGLTYGWVTQASVNNPGGGTPFNAVGDGRDRNRGGIPQELDTIMHMQRSGQTHIAWEMAVPNGPYTVTVSVGDAPGNGGVYDSLHTLTVEGVLAINSFQGTAAQEYMSATVNVNVTDGRLSVHAIGGLNTKLNYVHVASPVVANNMRVFENVTPGSYTITETVPGGWNFTGATCSGGGATSSVTNGITVQVGSGQDVVCTFNNAAAAGQNPAISISKDADQTIVSGSNAPFTIVVTNTGNVALSNVAVADPATPACAANIGTLAAGANHTYTCAATNVTATFTNTATASGTFNATTVTASDSAVVTVTPAPAPAISISKDADQTIVSGSNAPFTIVVTNTGNVALSNVAVADPATPACAANIGTLAAGANHTYTCAATNVTATFTNTATASGTFNATTVTASDSAVVTVTNAAMVVTKSPDQAVNPGDTANFIITVENTGTQDLTNITVTNNAACSVGATFTGGDLNTNNVLDPSETWSYTCFVDNVIGPFVTRATVTATTPTGSTITASDTATVMVNGITPSVLLTSGPPTQTLNSGEAATFTIVVENNGNIDLENVAISAPNAPDCVRSFASLPAGTSQTFTCIVAGVTGSFTNVLGASAQTINGGFGVTGNAASQVVINAPAPAQNPANNTPSTAGTFTASDPFITKNANPPFAIPGEAVTFTFVITNPGSVAAQNVVAVDPIPAEIEILSASAPVGTITVSGQNVTFSHAILQPGEVVTVTIQTRVRSTVNVPFIIINEVCMTADNLAARRCSTARVLSISALPATGETPLLMLILRRMLLLIPVIGLGFATSRFVARRNAALR